VKILKQFLYIQNEQERKTDRFTQVAVTRTINTSIDKPMIAEYNL